MNLKTCDEAWTPGADFQKLGQGKKPTITPQCGEPTGASVLPLIEGDPFRSATPPKPLLTDQQWLALQQICAG